MKRAFNRNSAYAYYADKICEILSDYEDIEEVEAPKEKSSGTAPNVAKEKSPGTAPNVAKEKLPKRAPRPKFEKEERIKLFSETCELLIEGAQRVNVPSVAVLGDVQRILKLCELAVRDSMKDDVFVPDENFQEKDVVVTDKYGQPIVDEGGNVQKRRKVLFSLGKPKKKAAETRKNRAAWVKRYAYEFEERGFASETDKSGKK